MGGGNDSARLPDEGLHEPAPGPAQDLDALFGQVYGELKRIAAGALAREGSGHTLVPTALVHEAYLKLARQRTDGWHSQTQFLGIAAQAMRRILTDYARMKKAAKRDMSSGSAVLDPIIVEWEQQALDLVELDEALAELAAIDGRKARVVELRFFGGLTAEQTAELLATPLRTVNRDWATARAWLFARLKGY